MNKKFELPKISRRTLPNKYPDSQAMSSAWHNIHSYHPDIWDLEYCPKRYLSRISDDYLYFRYGSITRNLAAFTTPGADIIPIKSWKSVWYWFRMEHQTRLEFAFRDLPDPWKSSESQQNEHPVSGRTFPSKDYLLFRYGKRKHMEELVSGAIRFTPAKKYAEQENNEARRDDELSKSLFWSGDHTKVTTEEGKEIPIIGNLTETISGPNYHMCCFSTEWDVRLFEAFDDADAAVVVVIDPEELYRRINDAGRIYFPGFYFTGLPVDYFDPFINAKRQFINPSIDKDFCFAYQKEFRFLWSQMGSSPISGIVSVPIGASGDIIKLVDRNGVEICD